MTTPTREEALAALARLEQAYCGKPHLPLIRTGRGSNCLIYPR